MKKISNISTIRTNSSVIDLTEKANLLRGVMGGGDNRIVCIVVNGACLDSNPEKKPLENVIIPQNFGG